MTNTRNDQSPTWNDVFESERALSKRLRDVLLEIGLDHNDVETWIEEHDRSELLLRPITKQEVRIKTMYAMKPPI